MLDFGSLPPEITSGWMYTGAGSGPLIAAASAWSAVAAELESAAQAAQTVITELSTEEWMGPASATMTAAVTPYLTWLRTTAADALKTSSQATASAAEFEAARAATVPPPVVAANRAQLAALVATNVLGQNTPAILATEAHYAAMWVQNSTAMFSYSAGSATSGKLTPLTAAPETTSTAAATSGTAAAASSAASDGLAQGVASLQSLLSQMGSAVDLALGTPAISNSINGVVNTAAWFVCNAIPTAVSLGHTMANAPVAAGAALLGSESLAAGLGTTLLADSAAPVAAVGSAPVAATLASASSVGRLSVPGTWSAALPAASSTGTATLAGGSGWTAAAEDEHASLGAVPAGMPLGAGGAGRGSGPRYGFKPTIMPKKLIV